MSIAQSSIARSLAFSVLSTLLCGEDRVQKRRHYAILREVWTRGREKHRHREYTTREEIPEIRCVVHKREITCLQLPVWGCVCTNILLIVLLIGAIRLYHSRTTVLTSSSWSQWRHVSSIRNMAGGAFIYLLSSP